MTSPTESQADLFSSASDVDLACALIAELHDDLGGKIARFRHLLDLSGTLGENGTMLPGGETAYTAWTEARASYVQGNFIGTILLAQGLAEHMLAAYLAMALGGEEMPPRIAFRETLVRCVKTGVISSSDAEDLRKLMDLRNPLSHYRAISDPANLTRRVFDQQMLAEEHLSNDASFAIAVAVRLLSLPTFRIGP